MATLFELLPEALVNSVAVAARCEARLDLHGELRLPSVPGGEGRSDRTRLREWCAAGLNERYPDGCDVAARERCPWS